MKYLVKLKPLDKFFFGREQTFEEDNYFAKSATRFCHVVIHI